MHTSSGGRGHAAILIIKTMVFLDGPIHLDMSLGQQDFGLQEGSGLMCLSMVSHLGGALLCLLDLLVEPVELLPLGA